MADCRLRRAKENILILPEDRTIERNEGWELFKIVPPNIKKLGSRGSRDGERKLDADGIVMGPARHASGLDGPPAGRIVDDGIVTGSAGRIVLCSEDCR
ncbi:hypothetical protein SLA2020_347600 [Shorea laevis]